MQEFKKKKIDKVGGCAEWRVGRDKKMKNRKDKIDKVGGYAERRVGRGATTDCHNMAYPCQNRGKATA